MLTMFSSKKEHISSPNILQERERETENERSEQKQVPNKCKLVCR